jgi:hypothetical protein
MVFRVTPFMGHQITVWYHSTLALYAMTKMQTPKKWYSGENESNTTCEFHF